MEAKDTVMKSDQFDELTISFESHHRRDLSQLVHEQAKISFKAGREAERHFILLNTDRDKRARLEGRREVVDWIPQLIQKIKNAMWKDDWGIKGVIYDDTLDVLVKRAIQAKLKEWGIKEE